MNQILRIKSSLDFKNISNIIVMTYDIVTIFAFLPLYNVHISLKTVRLLKLKAKFFENPLTKATLTSRSDIINNIWPYALCKYINDTLAIRGTLMTYQMTPRHKSQRTLHYKHIENKKEISKKAIISGLMS